MRSRLVVFIVVGLLFAGAGAFLANKQVGPQPPADDAVAAFFAQTLQDREGTSRALSRHRGQTLVVNFWATWCPPCVEEMPELVELHREMQPRNINVVGIGIDSASNIAEFSQKYKIDYPIYVAGMSGSDLSRQFGNKAGGLPFTVLIDQSGKIRKTYLGRLKMAELRQDLAGL